MLYIYMCVCVRVRKYYMCLVILCCQFSLFLRESKLLDTELADNLSRYKVALLCFAAARKSDEPP